MAADGEGALWSPACGPVHTIGNQIGGIEHLKNTVWNDAEATAFSSKLIYEIFL